MQYLYGEFSEEQINQAVLLMHNEIHKLLLHKDKKITQQIFNTEEDFINYFSNLLFRFGGLNKLLGEPPKMIEFMSTLQGAYDEVLSENFRYATFRKAILNCHGYLKAMFEIDEEVS